MDQSLILARETWQHQNSDDDVMSANCDVITNFQNMVNLEQSRSRIPDSWSVKLTYSLRVTFYLTKTEKRTKKSLMDNMRILLL